MLQVVPFPAAGLELSNAMTMPSSPVLSSAMTTSAVPFGRVGFVLMWAGIFSLHAVSAMYLIAAGKVYAALPTTQVCLVLQQYRLTLNPSHFATLARIHYVLACIHICFLIKPFVSKLLPVTRLTDSVASFHLVKLRPTSQSVRFVATQLTRRLKRLYNLVLARDGIFGIHNQYFDLVFLVREVIETVLQTYQAYTMSQLLQRVNLNGFYTAMIIINCWSTPLLKRVCQGNRPLERLLFVFCNIVLDFVSSVGVPVVIAIGYLQQYDPVATDFPRPFYYDDVWLLNFVNESSIVFFGSWFAALSRLVFSLGLLSSLEDVKTLVTRRKRGAVTTSKTSKIGSKSRVSIVTYRPELQYTITKWAHRGLVLWGLGIALIALQAYVRARPSHCALELRPWLATGPACAIVTMDCVKEPDFTGIAADFDAVFRDLDVVFVEHVVLHHCAHAEISPVLLSFRNLFGVRTYNTTIQIWSRDAALTATAHPRVRFAIFVRTDFIGATVPAGLHHEDAPMTLTDLEIVVSNINHLPLTLPWPPGMLICFEYTQFDDFPSVLIQAQPTVLSLAFNRISAVPTNVFESSSLVALFLVGNPIQHLPDTDMKVVMPNLRMISLVRTGVLSLPAWVTEEFVNQVIIFAAQSPLCLNVLQNESSAEREQLLHARPWLATVEASCAIKYGTFYPLEMDAP